MKRILILTVVLLSGVYLASAQSTRYTAFEPASVWNDTDGNIINAHGGGVIFVKNKYYWFGEKRGRGASEGVNVYSSPDLLNWKFERLALATDTVNAQSDIARGCIMERPKVIYNDKTGQYVMWFHLELKGQGYKAARAGVAVSENVTGPFRFINSFRPNGHMSRDMTLFKDDNGDAYHIYSSRENYDLRISKLSDDYLFPTSKDTLLFSNHREAPAIFKHKKNYYLITSGCTGWDPNKASLHIADNLFGPWKNLGDPMIGPNSELTFGGQSTYVLPVQGKKGAFIFMADKWNPRNLIDSRYIWLPVSVNDGKVEIRWRERWDLKAMKDSK